MSIYTLEAGRLVLCYGQPLATIHGANRDGLPNDKTATGYSPTEVDAFARNVVKHANAYPRLVKALRTTLRSAAEHDRVVGRAILRELGEE